MGRPQQVSDAEIRTVARREFFRAGPSAPVAAIANRLGISAPSLLERVGSKDRLLVRSLLPQRSDALKVFDSPPPPSDARRVLAQALVELMRFLRDLMPGLVVLRAAGHDFSAGLATRQPAPTVALRRALVRWLLLTKDFGVFSVRRARGVAEGLLGAMEARCFNMYVGGNKFGVGSDAAFIRMLLDGVAVPVS